MEGEGVGVVGCCRQSSTLLMWAASMCLTAVAVAEAAGSVEGLECFGFGTGGDDVVEVCVGVMSVFVAGVRGAAAALEVVVVVVAVVVATVVTVAVVVVLGVALGLLAGGAGGLGVCSKGGNFFELVAPDSAENTPCGGWLA